jgi:hypothetical protein
LYLGSVLFCYAGTCYHNNAVRAHRVRYVDVDVDVDVDLMGGREGK